MSPVVTKPAGADTPETASSSSVVAANHSIVVRADGTVWGWGNNVKGQLGDGTTNSPRLTPAVVPGLTGAVGVATAGGYSLAALADGTVRAWGDNASGELGDGTTTSRLSPVIVPGLTGVVSVAAGAASFALRNDGTVWAWGSNAWGQLGDGTTSGPRLSPAVVPGLTGVVAMATGAGHVLAVLADGTVRGWGYNGSGELGDGTTTNRLTPVAVPGLTGAVAVGGGASHSLALLGDGSVWAWGVNFAGQLGNGTTSGPRLTPAVVPALTGIARIAAGFDFSLAVSVDGTVRAWGRNFSGQLGDGTTIDRFSPIVVAGAANVVDLAAGVNHSLAILANGTMSAWGANFAGQLGDGTTNAKLSPVPVSGLFGVGIAGAAPSTTSELFGIANPAMAHVSCELSTEVGRNSFGANCATGNFWYQSEDIAVPAGRGVPLVFTHTYNSLSSTVGALGPCEEHSYEMSIVGGAGLAANAEDGQSLRQPLSEAAAVGDLTVVQENGSTVSFAPDGVSGYRPYPGVLATLVVAQDGGYTFTRHRDQIRHHFSADGKLATQTDLDGHVTTLSYLGTGQLDKVTDSEGRILQFSYSGARLTKVTDVAGGRSALFHYDFSVVADGRLDSITDVDGKVTQFPTYDALNNPTTIVDPRGATLRNTFVSSRLTAQTAPAFTADPATFTTTVSYQSGKTTVTDPRGRVTVQRYDRNRLMSLTRGYGTTEAATWRFAYDPATMGLRSVTDPNGHTETNTFDVRGNRLSHTDALGRRGVFTYNALNQMESDTDSMGVTTSSPHDPTNGHLLSVSRPLAGTAKVATTIFSYDTTPGRRGDLTKVTDARAKDWLYAYDTAGNLASVTDPLLNRTVFCYDAIGRMTERVMPRGSAGFSCPATPPTVSPSFGYLYTYTPSGDLKTTTDPLNHTSSRTYDANRNLASFSDPSIPPKVTVYDYNARNLRTTTTRADNSQLVDDYWPDGALKSRRDGAGQLTSYDYDALGRLTTTTDPLDRVTTRRYDRGGNLASVQDHGGACTVAPTFRCASYTYDAGDQLTAINYSDSTPDVSNVTYDGDGRRISMTDGTGTSSWVWDSLDRLTSSTSGATVAGGGQTVGYAYDLADNLTKLTYPGGLAVTRHFDAAGRMDWLDDWLGKRISFGYDANDNLRTTTGPGTTPVVDTITYDKANQVKSINVAQGATALANFTYTRTNADLVSTATSTGVPADNNTYTYTDLDQLDSVSGAALGYDPADNLTKLPDGIRQRFDVANQLCWAGLAATTSTCGAPPAGATTFANDTRGNRTTSVTAGVTTTYTYDRANRLTSQRSSGASPAPADYTYDGDGLRMAKTTGGTTTAFTWNVAQGMPLLLTEGSGTSTTKYIYGPQGLPVEKVNPSGGAQYYHQDQIGSTRLLTNATGSVVATFTWDAYGQLAARTGTTDQPFGYAGQYTDAETGFQYLRARYYDPATGQFLTKDPITDETGQPYGYVNGNPLNWVDQNGLFPVPPGGGWDNGWRNPDGTYSTPQEGGRSGGAAEDAVWDAVEAKPGWRVIRGRVYVVGGRVYDGAAISPRGWVIGLEVKSGNSRWNGSQRKFDQWVNSGNPAQGTGKHKRLTIRRVHVIKCRDS